METEKTECTVILQVRAMKSEYFFDSIEAAISFIKEAYELDGFIKVELRVHDYLVNNYLSCNG